MMEGVAMVVEERVIGHKCERQSEYSPCPAPPPIVYGSGAIYYYVVGRVHGRLRALEPLIVSISYPDKIIQHPNFNQHYTIGSRDYRRAEYTHR